VGGDSRSWHNQACCQNTLNRIWNEPCIGGTKGRIVRVRQQGGLKGVWGQSLCRYFVDLQSFEVKPAAVSKDLCKKKLVGARMCKDVSSEIKNRMVRCEKRGEERENCRKEKVC